MEFHNNVAAAALLATKSAIGLTESFRLSSIVLEVRHYLSLEFSIISSKKMSETGELNVKRKSPDGTFIYESRSKEGAGPRAGNFIPHVLSIFQIIF